MICAHKTSRKYVITLNVSISKLNSPQSSECLKYFSRSYHKFVNFTIMNVPIMWSLRQSLSQISPIESSFNKGKLCNWWWQWISSKGNISSGFSKSLHFISCSSGAWATKSACSLPVCVPSKIRHRNNLIRNNPAKNEYQRRRARRKSCQMSPLTMMWTVVLPQAKDAALVHFTTICWSYLLKILCYFLNINLLIVKNTGYSFNAHNIFNTE